MSALQCGPEDDEPEFYTPERVRILLKLYPYLADNKIPEDPHIQALAQQVFAAAGWEAAADKKVDLQRAIRWLNGIDYRAAYCVRASYIVGLSVRDIAAYLNREDGPVSHETVNCWRKDGFTNIVGFLRGEIGYLRRIDDT